MFRGSWTRPASTRRSAPASSARSGPAPTIASRAAPTVRDDAAHAAEYAKHPNNTWFTEWWYFNVRDEKTGLAFLAVYSASPYGLFGGGAFATMGFRRSGDPFEALDPYPPSQVKTSSAQADVAVGPNRIEVIDENRYRIVAASRDGKISWDLLLEREPGASPAWLLANAQGPLDWEVGWWMSWMPFARAKGKVTIDGTEYTIEDAAAYHDHNWGVWCAPARNWQWLQCSSLADRLALDLGYSDGFDPPRVAILILEGRTFEFDASGIDPPTYAGFEAWGNTPWKYPARATTMLIDRTDRLKVEVEWDAVATSLLPTALALFEQEVKVTLRVSQRGQDGAWEAPRTFAAGGIAEWSDSWVAEWQTGEGMIGGYVAEATIFGGGISGLTAAHELAERGFAVTVVEPEEALDAEGNRAMALGGMARSHYARVPRLGPAPVHRAAGRPTPDARDDRWGNRRIDFPRDAHAVPAEAEAIIARAAAAFLETYVEQGYRLRITGVASPVEKDPHALAARRAEAVRFHLEAKGVAPDCLTLAERTAAAPAAVIALEDYVLPGEHGFRFFPSYYRHVTDTMSRIPVYDHDGRITERRVLDNLRPTAQRLTLRSGKEPSLAPRASAAPLQILRQFVATLTDNDYDPRDFLQMGIRLSRYIATCADRRKPLEDISWWNYLCGFSPRTRCYLYRYSNAFSKDSVASGRVLAAFDWRYGDARTNGSTFVQLFDAAPGTSPSSFDGMLNGPTTEAWFVHWRRFLLDRGVRFVSGSLERLELEDAEGKDVVVPWVRTGGQREPAPWRGRTGEPHYFVVATDAPAAEHASAPLPKVGVPLRLAGYTTRFEGKRRDPCTDPGIAKNDRFQTLTGVQYFFDQSFAIGGGAYSLDAPWSLTTVSVQNLWSRIPFAAKDGYAGMLTVDIGDFKVPAGPAQETAWDSTRERIGEQVWVQLSNDLRMSPFGPSPLRLPRPTWFHIDDNIEFGDRDGRRGVVVRNTSPYLVPILADWRNRPGPEPFDPNVPAARRSPPIPSPGVWTALHGGYPVHWDTLVYAGIYLKTFTRMTTMESANESARHAVNAILDHYNAHHGSTVPPPSPPPARHPDPSKLQADEVPEAFLGDYCGIWNMERYEPSGFDTLKAVDQMLFDLGLPHVFDLLGVEILPSILSHLFPYRGDCSPTGEAPPKPIPPPAPWCPPFVGQKLGSAIAKIGSFVRRPKR